MAAGLVREFRPADFPAIEEIFWLTSARTVFASEAERTQFRRQYLEDYLPLIALVAEKEGRVLGYVLATQDTLAMEAHWPAHLALFRDQYESYPAHLHINCHPSSQGQGIGKALIMALEEALRQKGVRGVHLITAPSASNVAFYQRTGFSQRIERPWRDASLLMLAKSL